jgi:hypothetical protein
MGARLSPQAVSMVRANPDATYDYAELGKSLRAPKGVIAGAYPECRALWGALAMPG